ncbi:MAG TPA: hypothetical protein VFQ70_00540 [Candidatus Saccharimonadaceae bacterium]|nr:hypothetical protein [Candidatus Saccharimonadaceae bacterium]
MVRLFHTPDSAPRTRRELARERQRELGAAGVSASGRQIFHRSRTLTGSVSSQVRSTGETSAQLTSPRVRAHHLTRVRRHLGLAFLGATAIIMALAFVLSQLTANVTVTIDGDASVVAKADYVQSIEDYFNQAPIERLRFLAKSANLTSYLERTHPEVQSATVVGSGGFGVTTIALQMRKPVAAWTVNGVERFVDASGTSFQVNYFADPTVKIVDDSGVHLASGQTLFSNSFLGFVGRVVGLSKSLEGLTVTEITIPPTTTHQIEVSVAGVSYPAKLSIDRGAGEQVEDMARAEAWMKQHGITPSYIDVRVSGDAYYK